VTEQNRKYIKKEFGKLLSEIWRIKGLAEQEYGPQHLITKKLNSMHAEAQALLQENSWNISYKVGKQNNRVSGGPTPIHSALLGGAISP